MEPELVTVESCGRFFIVEQRWLRENSYGWSTTVMSEQPGFDTEFGYIFNVMTGPYARVYREWCRIDNTRRTAPKPRWAYIIEARTKRQVVNWLSLHGIVTDFNNRVIYPPAIQQGDTMKSNRQRQIEQAERTARRAQERIDFLLSLPDEPVAAPGKPNIVAFDKQFVEGGRVYRYAAIQANGSWFTTGPEGGSTPRTWDDLVTWINDPVPTIIRKAKKFDDI